MEYSNGSGMTEGDPGDGLDAYDGGGSSNHNIGGLIESQDPIPGDHPRNDFSMIWLDGFVLVPVDINGKLQFVVIDFPNEIPGRF